MSRIGCVATYSRLELENQVVYVGSPQKEDIHVPAEVAERPCKAVAVIIRLKKVGPDGSIIVTEVHI